MKAFLTNVTAWAAERPQIRALALVGSHGRGTARPDSDIDLLVLAEHPAEFLDDLGWTRLFGHVTREAKEDWGRVTSVRVFYNNNLEVEFGLTTPDWALAPDESTLNVLHDGLRVLLDRDGIFGHYPGSPAAGRR